MIKEEIYKFFANYILENSGMVYSANDYYRLQSRINELVKIFSANDVDDLYQMYKKNITPDMKAILINISTNNETYFFRDVKPFTVLSKVVLPELLLRTTHGPVNIWSAASSTGQEAFSMLMSTHQLVGDQGICRLNITASDISSDALKKAQSGMYSFLEIQRGLSRDVLTKYFSQIDENHWKINKSILDKIKFFEFNLLKGKFPKNYYHVIFCRNILIYQEHENKNLILKKIYDSLACGGYLFLGNGESLIGIETEFERVIIDNYTIFQKK